MYESNAMIPRVFCACAKIVAEFDAARAWPLLFRLREYKYRRYLGRAVYQIVIRTIWSRSCFWAGHDRGPIAPEGRPPLACPALLTLYSTLIKRYELNSSLTKDYILPRASERQLVTKAAYNVNELLERRVASGTLSKSGVNSRSKSAST